MTESGFFSLFSIFSSYSISTVIGFVIVTIDISFVICIVNIFLRHVFETSLNVLDYISSMKFIHAPKNSNRTKLQKNLSDRLRNGIQVSTTNQRIVLTNTWHKVRAYFISEFESTLFFLCHGPRFSFIDESRLRKIHRSFSLIYKPRPITEKQSTYLIFMVRLMVNQTNTVTVKQ